MEYYSPEKDIEIYYQLSGNENGPKMVLIHGLFLNSDYWKYQLPAFESKYHILRFDLRGHGRSTKPENQFKIRNYVDDMTSLLNHLNWTSELYLVGHSLGGMVALLYGLENLSNVKKMVVSDSFCFVAEEAVAGVVAGAAPIVLANNILRFNSIMAEFPIQSVTLYSHVLLPLPDLRPPLAPGVNSEGG